LKTLAFSSHFQKTFKKLAPFDQQKTKDSLKNFLTLLQSGEFSQGVGFKKIGPHHYEIRVDIRIRILMILEGSTFVCHLVGNHGDIHRFLKRI